APPAAAGPAPYAGPHRSATPADHAAPGRRPTAGPRPRTRPARCPRPRRAARWPGPPRPWHPTSSGAAAPRGRASAPAPGIDDRADLDRTVPGRGHGRRPLERVVQARAVDDRVPANLLAQLRGGPVGQQRL